MTTKKPNRKMAFIAGTKIKHEPAHLQIAVNDTKSGIRNGTITCAICGMKTQEQPLCSHLKFNKNDD